MLCVHVNVEQTPSIVRIRSLWMYMFIWCLIACSTSTNQTLFTKHTNSRVQRADSHQREKNMSQRAVHQYLLNYLQKHSLGELVPSAEFVTFNVGKYI